MKKIIIYALLIVAVFILPTVEALTIPKEAIRIRVIADNNSIESQNEKKYVSKNLEEFLNNLLKDVKDIKKARKLIKNNLDNIHKNIEKSLKDLKSKTKFKVNFGQNKFPKKEFKGVIYKSGEYESLVVTLGNGNGDNWWCVLFPPLCLVDAKKSDKNDVEYQFFIKKMIDKIFK